MNELVYNVPVVRDLREMMTRSAREYADNVAFLFKRGERVIEISYDRAMREIIYLATYLNSLGLEGQKIAVIGKNSYEWALTYLAVCCGVGIIVPIDKELKSHEVQNILDISKVAAVVYAPEVKKTLDGCTGDFKRLSTSDFPEFKRVGQTLLDTGDKSYEQHHVDPYALGILLFTSGTTGVAKGVMLSQNNVVFDVISVRKVISLSPEDRSLSVLPLHHTYECTAGFLTMLYGGASIAYNESLRTIPADLQLYNPTVFIGVPLLFENMLAGIVKKYKAIKGGAAVFAASKALAIPLKHDARRKLFSTVHKFFGGKMRRFICGAAALNPETFRTFELLGFEVHIGYGLTETSPVCILHGDFYRNPDDIGMLLPGLSAKIIDPDKNGVGELAVKGDNVMLGYYENPTETERVMHDGWFYTGDLAQQKENGAYKIVGRCKNMIVVDNGKRSSPRSWNITSKKTSLSRRRWCAVRPPRTAELRSAPVCSRITRRLTTL
ncbi:MAG TPA: AMP-binding protein [Oscillospiraceae bacterium]|nr:AMP-binding protein [Oscillospiraceae bacterium]